MTLIGMNIKINVIKNALLVLIIHLQILITVKTVIVNVKIVKNMEMILIIIVRNVIQI